MTRLSKIRVGIRVSVRIRVSSVLVTGGEDRTLRSGVSGVIRQVPYVQSQPTI